jgi:hypothetical protein
MPVDEPDERMRELAASLTSDGPRVLAYTLAYALAAADAGIAPEEHAYMAGLRAALQIPDARARALADTVLEEMGS